MPTFLAEEPMQSSDLVIEEFDGWQNPPASAQISLCICWSEPAALLVAP